ncbi:MAG: DUF4358 domain-containing protein [Clostridia bacterium]|nr:DUF4358 domain-containing protein [Clostridia bacterium]
MKHGLAFLLALSFCLVLLPSYAEKAAETLLDRALRVAEDSDNLIRMDEDELYDVVGIAPEDYSDYAYLADYDALSGRELVFVRAVDEEAAERIFSQLSLYLEHRLKATRNYLPDVFRALSEAGIRQRDLLLVLSVAPPDPEEAIKLLQEE